MPKTIIILISLTKYLLLENSNSWVIGNQNTTALQIILTNNLLRAVSLLYKIVLIAYIK